jgi:phosphoglycolate phosphatase
MINSFDLYIHRTADVTESKPHPQMLLELLAETGALAERTIMVGDSVLDMQLATNAGTACVGVGFGAEPEDELLQNGAPFCASSWPELVMYIEETLVG